MRVRPFVDGDADAIGAILAETWGHDPRLLALHGGGHGAQLDEPFRRTLIAEVDGKTVGAGTVFHGSFHPLHTGLDLVVAPRFRRRGVGSALLNELRGIAPVPICARTRDDQSAAAPFLLRHGFGLVNRSWEGRFDPADSASRLPEPQLVERPTPEEAAEFFERWYFVTHDWDPPARMPLEQALSFFCGDNVIPASLVGVREAGRLTGAANLIGSLGYDPGDELYLVWIGVLPADDETATSLVAACARFTLAAGKALRFELDESNAAVWAALDRLGVLGDPALEFYAEDAEQDRIRSGEPPSHR